jgi:tetratricopeptide (TPR) repeat protein
VALAAIVYVALAFADGGYFPQARAIATAVVWLIVSIGVLARLWRPWPLPRVALLAGGCLAAVTALSALSMVWADDAGRSFDAAVTAAGYLGLFTLVAFAAPRTGIRPWLVGLTIALTIVCLAALATRFDPSLFGGGDRSLEAALPTAQGRLSYPIGYWNALAASVALGAVLLAWLGVEARSRAGRAAAVALIPLPALAIYLSSSRGGYGTALVGGVVLVLVVAGRSRPALLSGVAMGALGGGLLILLARSRVDFVRGLDTDAARDDGLVMAMATLACVLVVGGLRYLLDDRMARLRMPPVRGRVVGGVVGVIVVVLLIAADPAARFREFTSNEAGAAQRTFASASGSFRYQYWQAAVEAYASEPITGIGAGNYELYWSAHPEARLAVINAHSLYLETLAELGVPGLALVLGFIAAPVVAGIRRRRAGDEYAVALAVLAAGAFTAAVEWTWQIPAAFAPVVVVAALLTSRATAPERGASLRFVRPGPVGRFAANTAVLLIAWTAIWAAGILFASDFRLEQSGEAAARGDLTEAAAHARDAAALEPWSPEPRLQLALVDELGQDLSAARTAVQQAIDRAPGDWRPWAVASRIDRMAGDHAAAQLEWAKAQSLSPLPLPARAGPNGQ